MGRRLAAKKKQQLMAATERKKILSHSTRVVLRIIEQNVQGANISAPEVQSFTLLEPTLHSEEIGTGHENVEVTAVDIPHLVRNPGPACDVSHAVTVESTGPVMEESPSPVHCSTPEFDLPVPNTEPEGNACEEEITLLSDTDEEPDSTLLEDVIDRVSSVAEELGVPLDSDSLQSCISSGAVHFRHTGDLHMHKSRCSWHQWYPVISFLICGHLHADYNRLSGLLGLPSCSSTQWGRIVKRLEEHVTDLAEWSCGQVRHEIAERGDADKWMASFDGFYLTRGHYSNNSSATLHDHLTGKIAYFCHRTKRGPGHNWSGTSGGTEADMLDELLRKAKDDGMVVTEIITDKDTSINSIFCRHYPEGLVTYCSNHCAKTLHKDLEKIKRNPCECHITSFRCKRMSDSMLRSCKTSLSNLIASDKMQSAQDPHKEFVDAIRNFIPHYCLNVHTSQWCVHEKRNPDGSAYSSDHAFTCKAQVEGFRNLIEGMAARPQDYVSDHGRLTTNTLEGFHGMALVYRSKRTDLGHAHYTCKTNMAICHKNLGPIWKVLCLVNMGVDIPAAAVASILSEQKAWKADKMKRSSATSIHKRNLQKRAKKARYEAEKDLMGSLKDVGYAVGEYVGDGKGEADTGDGLVDDVTDVDLPDSHVDTTDDQRCSSEQGDRVPLLILYDCEATGLSTYTEHLTDIAAKVLDPPIPVPSPTFSSLVRTSRNISAPVSRITGITSNLLRGERPLSIVLPMFLEWLTSTVDYVSIRTKCSYYPVLVAHNGFKYDFPILLAEMERRPELVFSQFISGNVHFSDTLPLLRKMKKDGEEVLQGASLAMEKLHIKIVGSPIEGAHRALPDVLALERVITHSSLAGSLANLCVRTPHAQLSLWISQRNTYTRAAALIKSVGRPSLTSAQAKKLGSLGIGYPELLKLREDSGTKDVFLTALKDKGIRSKPLREKLAKALGTR